VSLNILFFGELADAAKYCFGGENISFDFDDKTNSLDQLEATLGSQHQALADIFSRKDHLRSVNQALTHTDMPLSDGDEVAFMSPFSGG